MDIEILPSSTLFRAGESLRLVIQGEDLFDRRWLAHISSVNREPIPFTPGSIRLPIAGSSDPLASDAPPEVDPSSPVWSEVVTVPREVFVERSICSPRRTVFTSEVDDLVHEIGANGRCPAWRTCWCPTLTTIRAFGPRPPAPLFGQ